MDTGFSELQVFISLVVVLGTAFVALVVDYLKGNNERLREFTVELRTRREENERTRPLEAVQWLQSLLASARSAQAPSPVGPVAAAKPAREVESQPVKAAEPVVPARLPIDAQPAPSSASLARPTPAAAKAMWEARREALRRVTPELPQQPAPVAEPAPQSKVEAEPEPLPSLLESLPTPEWLEREREAAAAPVAETQPEPQVEEIAPAPVSVVEAPPPAPAVAEVAAEAVEPEPIIEAPVPPPPVEAESRVERNWRPKPEPVILEVAAAPVLQVAQDTPVAPAAAFVPSAPTLVSEPVEPEPAAPVAPRQPERDNFWTYRGLLDRVVAEQEVRVAPPLVSAPPVAANPTVAEVPPPAASEPETVPANHAAQTNQPPPVKSPLSKWASRLQTNRGMQQRSENSAGAGSGKTMPSWVDRALQKEAERAIEPLPEPVLEAPAVSVPAPEPQVVEAVAIPEAQPVSEPEELMIEATDAPVEELVAEPLPPPVIEAVVEPPAEPPVEPDVEPTVEAVAEPIVVEAVAEPAVEEVVEEVAEAAVEPVFEPVVEPVVQAVAEPVTEPVAELVVEAVAEPEAESVVEAVVEPVAVEPVAEFHVEFLETPAGAEPLPVVAPEPAPMHITPGYHDRSVLTTLMQSAEPVNGVLVAIGINDYQHNIETMGRQAMQDLMRSVERMIRGLLREEDFACRSNDDEFILFFPDETGAAAQRRLTTISEKLWNFQLRSLSSFSVLFSWGAVETQGDSFSDAVSAASERMYQTKRSRKVTDQRKKLAV